MYGIDEYFIGYIVPLHKLNYVAIFINSWRKTPSKINVYLAYYKISDIIYKDVINATTRKELRKAIMMIDINEILDMALRYVIWFEQRIICIGSFCVSFHRHGTWQFLQ